jgi:hypothetical protein
VAGFFVRDPYRPLGVRVGRRPLSNAVNDYAAPLARACQRIRRRLPNLIAVDFLKRSDLSASTRSTPTVRVPRGHRRKASHCGPLALHDAASCGVPQNGRDRTAAGNVIAAHRERTTARKQGTPGDLIDDTVARGVVFGEPTTRGRRGRRAGRPPPPGLLDRLPREVPHLDPTRLRLLGQGARREVDRRKAHLAQ